MKDWFEIANPNQILSPALLFYPDRVQGNIEEMIRIAGTANRLRPHVKTYKCQEIVKMQLNAGIAKFKCATLAEAEMLVSAGAKDILLAYPLMGPMQRKFCELTTEYPQVKFSTLIDHEDQILSWEGVTQSRINAFIDLNVGMNRTGISPQKADALFQRVNQSNFSFKGWHVYDGHIPNKDLTEREDKTEQAFVEVKELMSRIGHTDPIEIVCGGSITFPIHAQHPDRQLSPGTTLLWDQGYSSHFPDLKFKIAATLLTRVVSKPQNNMLCLDLGHKAVGSEMNDQPVYFPQIPDAKLTGHSEEHLVIETYESDNWNIGDVVYGLPQHICPTVALHEQVAIIRNNKVEEFWNIEARKRNYQL
jgi:D-serine deaminase-like pyridoxal phosphate-dependent protein